MILFIYCAKELIFPFLLAEGVISSILLMDQVYRFIPFIQTSGIEVSSLFLMISYSLAPVLMMSTPISMMIAIYIGIYRVSSDHEIIAMRSAGISLSFLVKPVLFVSGGISVFSLIMTMYLSPMGISNLEKLKFNILKKQARLNLESGRINNFWGKKMIYVADKREDTLLGVFIADWEQHSGSSVIEAKSGKIYFDENNQKVLIKLSNGRIHAGRKKETYRYVEFEHLDYDLKPAGLEPSDVPSRYKRKYGHRGKLDTELTLDELVERVEKSPAQSKDYFEYSDELHSRFVTVLSCITFALFALPMGIFNPRNPKTGKFVYMIIMMIVYFVIFSKMRSLLVSGKTHPAMLYSPLLLSLVIGGLNFLKINHDIHSIGEYITLKFKR